MNLLIISEDKQLADKFDEYFEEVKLCSMADIRLNASNTLALAEGEDVTEFDSLFVYSKAELAIFTKVLLESLTGSGVATNIGPAAFYILAKKQWMFKVLKEKGVPIPKTRTTSLKGVTGLNSDFNYPVVGKRYIDFQLDEARKLISEDEAKSFATGADYSESVIILHELTEGETFETLMTGEDVVGSIKMEGDIWNLKSTEKYYSPSKELRSVTLDAAQSIGASVCSVQTLGNKVYDINPLPDLERFKEVTGKNPYKNIAKLFKSRSESNSQG